MSVSFAPLSRIITPRVVRYSPVRYPSSSRRPRSIRSGAQPARSPGTSTHARIIRSYVRLLPAARRAHRSASVPAFRPALQTLSFPGDDAELDGERDDCV